MRKKNYEAILCLTLFISGCTSPSQVWKTREWEFVGMAHPGYHGNLGYTGGLTISGDEMVFTFQRAPSFPAETNGFLRAVVPEKDWGEDFLQYSVKVVRKHVDGREALIVSGPPYDGLEIMHLENGDILIGLFDPPFFYRIKKVDQ